MPTHFILEVILRHIAATLFVGKGLVIRLEEIRKKQIPAYLTC
jgi:hypothetical protein